MQRREQQRRAATGGGGMGGGMYGGLGSGISGYSPVSQKYDAPDPVPARTSSPAQSALRPPAFKGSGMKLGSKKVKQDQLLDALGGEIVSVEDLSAPPTPAASTPEPQARGATLPPDAER
jgi:coatomer subunit delta